jgi:hypothetical protein
MIGRRRAERGQPARRYSPQVTVLLGGDACPLGACVQFVDAPLATVEASLSSAWKPHPTERALPDALDLLLPFEAPWSRLLIAPAGRWTAVVNNFINGGDSTAPAPALARDLSVTVVIASHVPRYGPGHQATQLEVLGPSGKPPLMYVRSISATATDGRWEWHASGDPLPFENVRQYHARRVRDRLDRATLLTYLTALEIPATDDANYGPATLLTDRQTYPRRQETLQQARAHFT